MRAPNSDPPIPSLVGPLPLRQTQRSPEGPRHLHRIPRLSEEKQRYYFVNKGLSSQGYGFSSGHVWM